MKLPPAFNLQYPPGFSPFALPAVNRGIWQRDCCISRGGFFPTGPVTVVNRYRLLFFLLLSATDVSLTWYLLHCCDGKVYESNPIARWILEAYGWSGMVALKAVTVLVTAGIALYLAPRRPQWSEGTLGIGCLILMGVVGYSGYLAGVVHFKLDPDLATLDQETERHQWIQHTSQVLQSFRQERDRLAEKLVREEITLPEAAVELSRTEQLQESNFLTGLQCSYGRRSAPEYMAICLVECTLEHVEEDLAAVRHLATHLVDQFRAAYFRDPPWSPDQLVQHIERLRLRRAALRTGLPEPAG